MRKTAFTLSLILISITGYTQHLPALFPPTPDAICAEAPMPEKMAEKFARIKKERDEKFITPTQGAKAGVDAAISGKMDQYVEKGADAYAIRYHAADYRIYAPNYKLVNTSHGREEVKGTGGKFNPKRDRVSYAVLNNGNEIQIINKEHKAVDMSEFEFTTGSETIHMEKNKIVLSVPTMDIARGVYPLSHKIRCRHYLSDAEYTFDLQMYWTKKMNLSGKLCSFALTPIKSEAADNLGLLCNLDSKMLTVVELPLLIDGDGINGANGKKGRYGANGSDQKSYTDSNGNTKTVAGTCGKPGENGGDGGDGTDGGRFLLCISPELVQAYGMDGLVVTIDAGLGGKGGKGGEGGIHGKGSGCKGKAENGKDGKDGKDGKRGDFLYVLSDVQAFYQRLFQ